MTTTGKVVNGRIELAEPGLFPEGTEVWIGNRDDAVEGLDEDYPGPPADETYEEHLAGLSQSIADAKAGLGIPLDEAMALLRAEIEAMPCRERDR